VYTSIKNNPFGKVLKQCERITKENYCVKKTLKNNARGVLTSVDENPSKIRGAARYEDALT